MSEPAVAALAPQPLDFELVFDDGEPVESPWHYSQMKLLFDLLARVIEEQGRTDVYMGANQFVYYSVEQARHVAQMVAKGRPLEVRGPDVIWIGGVEDPLREREGWVAWQERGKLPDVIFELLSKSNTLAHRRDKKALYSRVFRTAEYFVYGRKLHVPEGFRLTRGGEYRPIPPDEQGRLWSEQLGCFVGPWHGVQDRQEADWIRLYRPDGSLVPTPQELAEAERRQAAAERRRAEAAESELARLRALLNLQSGG